MVSLILMLVFAAGHKRRYIFYITENTRMPYKFVQFCVPLLLQEYIRNADAAYSKSVLYYYLMQSVSHDL